MSPVRLSVVIPMYQSAATIAETIRSVQADRVDGGVEIVVVNDGSTDSSPAIVARMAEQDRRIRLISRPNGGLAAARNTGIDAAGSEFVRFLDADDLVTPGSANRLIRAAGSPEVGGACGSFELRDQEGISMRYSVPPRASENGFVGLGEMFEGNAVVVGAVTVRRSVFGGDRFDERLRECEDWDLWLRLAARGVRFASVPEPAVMGYRVRRDSLSANFARMLETSLGVQRRAFAAAREAGIAGCSLEREWRGAAGIAIIFAGMTAARGDPAGALRMLECLDGGEHHSWTAAEIGRVGVWAVLKGCGLVPRVVGSAGAGWMSGLERWWSGMEAGGMLADASGVDDAWRGFVRALAWPEVVAARIRDELGAGRHRSVVLFGFGKNGWLLARDLLEAGVAVRARDHRWPEGSVQEGAGLVVMRDGSEALVTVEPIGAECRPEDAIVLTPERDEGLVAMAPRTQARWRWTEASAAVASERWRELEVELRVLRGSLGEVQVRPHLCR